MKIKIKINNGFTLIESILYIGIFSLIMVGTLVSVYAIISSSSRNQTKAMVQEEGSFVLSKIEWALTGVKTAVVSIDGKSLSIVKFDSTINNPIVVAIINNNISLSRGSNAAKILNNSNTTIICPVLGCFIFTKEAGVDTDTESIKTQFTITAKTSEGSDYTQGLPSLKFIKK